MLDAYIYVIVWFSEKKQQLFPSIASTEWLVQLRTERVCCAVRSESSNKIRVIFRL